MCYEIIRDPLWNNIRVGPLTLRLIDTREFQRLRYVRQLGLAYLVYPGATHSRFEHARITRVECFTNRFVCDARGIEFRHVEMVA